MSCLFRSGRQAGNVLLHNHKFLDFRYSSIKLSQAHLFFWKTQNYYFYLPSDGLDFRQYGGIMSLFKIFAGIFVFALLPATLLPAQLSVNKNGRHLVHADGRPFFWLGDTGWALFQKIDREEVTFYFKTRADQGFTVIHAAVYHKNPFVLPPLSNTYGDFPFIDDNPTRPLVTPGSNPSDSAEYDYWDHVEFVIDEAARFGLFITFLPVFGVVEGDGYNALKPGNAESYGRFLGKRFRNKSNIFWCMGGDVLADTDTKKAVWNNLARGITIGIAGSEDYDKTLMTFHVRGGLSSSEFFPDAPWLDFHMLQTWASYTSIYDAVFADYARAPVKPILHGEGAYEDGPEYPTKPITPHVIRNQFYWAWFAGGFHTYGNSNVWNFGSTRYYVSSDWKDALRSPGARDLSVGRKNLESLQIWTFIPDPSIILRGASEDRARNVAMRSPAGDRLIVYLPLPATLSVDLKKLESAGAVRTVWINPQTGDQNEPLKQNNTGEQTVTTPAGWEDALLLICADPSREPEH